MNEWWTTNLDAEIIREFSNIIGGGAKMAPWHEQVAKLLASSLTVNGIQYEGKDLKTALKVLVTMYNENDASSKIEAKIARAAAEGSVFATNMPQNVLYLYKLILFGDDNEGEVANEIAYMSYNCFRKASTYADISTAAFNLVKGINEHYSADKLLLAVLFSDHHTVAAMTHGYKPCESYQYPGLPVRYEVEFTA